MDRTRASQLWQDTVLAVHHKLMLQTDISSVLRTIKVSCLPITPLQRINLLLANPLKQQITIYTLEEVNEQFQMTQGVIKPTQEQMLYWYQHAAGYYNQTSLEKDFPSIAKLSQYVDMGECYRLPLQTPEKYLGAVEFIAAQEGTFNEDVRAFLYSLSTVLTSTISNLVKLEELKQENEKLTQERNHFSILVDVTNTAIFTLDMESMTNDVAKEIFRYFGIRFSGIFVRTAPEEGTPFRLYNALHHPDGVLEHDLKTQHIKTPFCNQVMQTNMPVLVKDAQFAEIHPQDPLNGILFKNEFRAACMLPLSFGPRVYGVLCLAHEQAEVFSKYNITLLHQIADRVAVAVHNVLDYEALAAQKEELTHENLYLAEQILIADSYGAIVGTSESIRKVLSQVEMVANNDSTVLILGETGTGKELFAQAVHDHSLRKSRRMIKLNCAAMPSGLLESELFGHERGAFTGAATQRKGRFELADGSTLMLDEVGDIPIEMQPKLLRALQEREIERLGSSKTIPVDVRLVAATNRNLRQMVEDKAYRADLYYRLNVFPIMLPPLRERKEDIPLLAQFFTQKLAKQMRRDIKTIPAKAIKQLCKHYWPGNVRELANVIERAVILSNGATLNLQMHETEHENTVQGDPHTLQSYASTYGERAYFKDLSMANPSGGSGTSGASGASATDSSVAMASMASMASTAFDAHSTEEEEEVFERPIVKDVKIPVQESALEDLAGEALEYQRIINALRESNGVVAGPRGAAIKLGLKRTTLLSRMQRLGITAKDAIGEADEPF